MALPLANSTVAREAAGEAAAMKAGGGGGIGEFSHYCLVVVPLACLGFAADEWLRFSSGPASGCAACAPQQMVEACKGDDDGGSLNCVDVGETGQLKQVFERSRGFSLSVERDRDGCWTGCCPRDHSRAATLP